MTAVALEIIRTVTGAPASVALAEPLSLARNWSSGRALAVTIQAVEPRSFQRVRQIRQWLADRGIDRVTLAVIPAADLHPVGSRSPLLAAWLRGRVARGDAIAQHGLRPRGGAAEFAHLSQQDSRARVHAGRALLREVELDPQGFIAPAYGYTAALRSILPASFAWFGERARVRGTAHSLHAPVVGLSGARLVGAAAVDGAAPGPGAARGASAAPRHPSP